MALYMLKRKRPLNYPQQLKVNDTTWVGTGGISLHQHFQAANGKKANKYAVF